MEICMEIGWKLMVKFFFFFFYRFLKFNFCADSPFNLFLFWKVLGYALFPVF